MNSHTAFTLHQASLRCQEKLQKPSPHAGSTAQFPCCSQGEVLPSFVSAVSGWPSVLLPLSEAAEYLSDTSTCKRAPDTSSPDARNPFLQPAPTTSAFFPPPKLQGSTHSAADAFRQTPLWLPAYAVPSPSFLSLAQADPAHEPPRLGSPPR